jgi:Kef-type K+ transport system membrane component KefB
MQILLVLFICLVAVYAASEFCRYIKLPRVIGQMSVGLVLGVPFVHNLIVTDSNIGVLAFLADIGIILLFFFVGLEIDFKAFKKNVAESSYISFFNTLLPLIAGFLVSYYYFGFNVLVSVLIAVSLSVSAQGAALDLLDELGLRKTKIGRAILAAGSVDDVFELLLISSVLALVHAAGSASLFAVFLDFSLFIVLLLFFRYVILPFVVRTTENESHQPNFFLISMIVVLFMAGVSDYLGLGAILGALFAGVIARRSMMDGRAHWKEHELANTTHLVSFGFLVPMFFIWVGLNVDLVLVFTDYFWFTIAITLIAIIGTVVGSIIGVEEVHKSLREGVLIGWGLTSKGDVELVLVEVARQAGVISVGVFSSIVVMAFVTTLVAPIMFRIMVTKHHWKLLKRKRRLHRAIIKFW